MMANRTFILRNLTILYTTKEKRLATLCNSLHELVQKIYFADIIVQKIRFSSFFMIYEHEQAVESTLKVFGFFVSLLLFLLHILFSIERCSSHFFRD